jgi:hypothetical protein
MKVKFQAIESRVARPTPAISRSSWLTKMFDQNMCMIELEIITMVTNPGIWRAFRYCRVRSNWEWRKTAGIIK